MTLYNFAAGIFEGCGVRAVVKYWEILTENSYPKSDVYYDRRDRIYSTAAARGRPLVYFASRNFLPMPTVYDLLSLSMSTTILTRHRTSTNHSLTFRVRRYVVIATKCVHRLQIRPIVHNNPTIFPNYIRVRTLVRECGEGQTYRRTHKHTDVRDQYTFNVVYYSREMYY